MSLQTNREQKTAVASLQAEVSNTVMRRLGELDLKVDQELKADIQAMDRRQEGLATKSDLNTKSAFSKSIPVVAWA